MSRLMLDAVRERVAEAVDHGATLDEVEDEVLRDVPVSRDERDALWLYAWNLREIQRESPRE